MFDPNEVPDEKNSLHRQIHEEYKHLVDFMLGSFMEEMQITPEQFEIACLAGKHSTTGIAFHHGRFQQVRYSLFVLYTNCVELSYVLISWPCIS